MDLAPETATVRQADGSWKEIAAKEVAKGAVVRVRPGERIALDGQITAGRSAINQAPITGESLPVGETAVRRHQPVSVPDGNLDMIAEHRIVPDPERRDPGGVAVRAFERGDGSAAVRCGGAQGVERGVVAFRDVAALRCVNRRGFDQRPVQLVDEGIVPAE